MLYLFLNNSGPHGNGGLEGDAFFSLLDFAALEADYFSLSKTDRGKKPNPVEELLAPYLIKRITPKSWYGNNRLSCSTTELVYTVSDKSIDVLRESFSDIFLRGGKSRRRFAALEDLCFWKDRSMLIGTLSHELICSTNSLSAAQAEKLKRIADWREEKTPSCFIEAQSL